MQVEVIDRHQQIEISEHEIKRKLCELDAQIKRPAEAEKYRLEMLAGDHHGSGFHRFKEWAFPGLFGPFPAFSGLFWINFPFLCT